MAKKVKERSLGAYRFGESTAIDGGLTVTDMLATVFDICDQEVLRDSTRN